MTCLIIIHFLLLFIFLLWTFRISTSLVVHALQWKRSAVQRWLNAYASRWFCVSDILAVLSNDISYLKYVILLRRLQFRYDLDKRPQLSFTHHNEKNQHVSQWISLYAGNSRPKYWKRIQRESCWKISLNSVIPSASAVCSPSNSLSTASASVWTANYLSASPAAVLTKRTAVGCVIHAICPGEHLTDRHACDFWFVSLYKEATHRT